MSRFDGLPDEVQARLKTDPRHTSGNELLPAEVAAAMRAADRPIWTAAQLQAELDTSHRTETVRKKLRTLEELGICASMEANNGRIYWWADDRSEWPLPPDVTVEGQNGVTVEEFLAPWYAKLGLLGLLGPTIAGVPLLVAVFAIGGTLTLPVPASEVLSWGLIVIVISYLLLVYAGVLGLLEWATGDEVTLDPF